MQVNNSLVITIYMSLEKISSSNCINSSLEARGAVLVADGSRGMRLMVNVGWWIESHEYHADNSPHWILELLLWNFFSSLQDHPRSSSL